LSGENSSKRRENKKKVKGAQNKKNWGAAVGLSSRPGAAKGGCDVDILTCVKNSHVESKSMGGPRLLKRGNQIDGRRYIRIKP